MVQIEINHVTKRIHKNTVLEDITALMQGGRIYGIQGVNGSGKTMLMRIIIGLIRPSRGSVSINGRILGRDIEFPESIGFLLENPAFLGRYSGFDNLNMLAGIKKLASPEQVRKSIRMVGLDPSDKKKYRKYSLGMKQRLGIAIALLNSPQLLILDEPTNGLDPLGIEELRELIRSFSSNGITVILSSHILSEVQQIADHVGIIAGGVLGYEGKLHAGEDLEQLFMDVIRRNGKEGY